MRSASLELHHCQCRQQVELLWGHSSTLRRGRRLRKTQVQRSQSSLMSHWSSSHLEFISLLREEVLQLPIAVRKYSSNSRESLGVKTCVCLWRQTTLQTLRHRQSWGNSLSFLKSKIHNTQQHRRTHCESKSWLILWAYWHDKFWIHKDIDSLIIHHTPFCQLIIWRALALAMGKCSQMILRHVYHISIVLLLGFCLNHCSLHWRLGGRVFEFSTGHFTHPPTAEATHRYI